MANVKVYRSTDYGAPSFIGNIGGGIPTFDAVLINGYGTLNVTSLTHSGGIVTAVTQSGHNLTTNGTQLIAGANESGYNGEFRITVVDNTTFTYQASGISVNTATGTITTKTPGAGWSKAYSGTNLAAYRPGSGNRHYLRIDDTVAQNMRVVGYEDMTAISTGTNAFPSSSQQSGGFYWKKSSTTDAVARPWIIIADDKTMYMFVDESTTMTYSTVGMYGFGDFISYKGGDIYSSFLAADATTSYTGVFWGTLLTYYSAATSAANQGLYAPRSFSQIGSSVPMAKIGDYSKSQQAQMGTDGMTYPHQCDGALWMKQVEFVELAAVGAQNNIRGKMRGVWTPLHTRPLAHGDMFNGSGDLAGKKFLTLSVPCSTSAMAQCMIDISLTW